MGGNHLRPVALGEGHEPIEEPQAAHEVARRLLVEAEVRIRDPRDGMVYPENAAILATIALGWATLALTEPPIHAD